MAFPGRQDSAQAAAGAPSPDALLPALDERQLAILREVGREWDRLAGDPQAWQRALPVDPDLGSYPRAHGRARAKCPGNARQLGT
jgi:hypothetical protein